MDVERLRDDTPGCTQRVHLNNAGAALMPSPVIAAVQDHVALESRIGGYEAADARADGVAAAYRAVAKLIGAEARNIAFTQSATGAYGQALSSIPFERGDTILTTRNDYVSNQLQFLSLEDRLGVRVARAPDVTDGGVDVDALADMLRRERPRVVCVTHVPTNSGLVQDVEAIGRLCRQHDVLYLVDACQSVGQMPVDVEQIRCDFLSATSRKYLRGPRGAGFLFASDRVIARGLAPLLIDMRGAEWIAEGQYRLAPDARRYETFEQSIAAVLGIGEAARYASAVGLDAARDRIGTLARRLREGLARLERVRVLDAGAALCGIVSISVDGHDPRELMNALRMRNINTNAQTRPSALLDYDAKGVSGSLRFSPHYFNTERELDDALLALEELLQHPQRTP